jgi:hypothetical protein
MYVVKKGRITNLNSWDQGGGGARLLFLYCADQILRRTASASKASINCVTRKGQ